MFPHYARINTVKSNDNCLPSQFRYDWSGVYWYEWNVNISWITKKNSSFVSFSIFGISSWVMWPCVSGYMAWSLDRKGSWNRWWVCFTLTYNPTKFDNHWRCELEMHHSGNLAWSHDRWITWLDGCGQLNLSHTLLELGAIALAKVEIKSFFIYHVTL